MRPFALGPGEGESVQNPVGGVLTFKAMGSQTDGELTALDTVAAAGEGPPLHVHRGEDELIYIVDGTFRVRLADELIDARGGSFVFIPRGTPHTWQNIGSGPGRFFAGVMPAATGFEEFFKRYAELPPDDRGADAFARLGLATGALEVLGPPLAQCEPC